MNPSRPQDNRGGPVVSPWLVSSLGTLAGRTTFLYLNTMARLTRSALGMKSVTWCLDLKFKAEISIYKEDKINSAKPTVIEWLRETWTKRDIYTFDYSIINNWIIMQGQIQPIAWGNERQTITLRSNQARIFSPSTMEQSQLTFVNYLMHTYETAIFHFFFMRWKVDAI